MNLYEVQGQGMSQCTKALQGVRLISKYLNDQYSFPKTP